MSTELLWRIEEIRDLVDTYFPVRDIWFNGGRPAFAIDRPADAAVRFIALRERLEPLGYLPALRKRDGTDLLVLLPAPPAVESRWPLNLALFLATLASTLFVGYIQADGLVRAGYLSNAIWGAVLYAIPLMGILLTHEMGHKIVAVVRGIRASLPYFIPFPLPPVGTMGAVIVTRSPAPSRDSLMELGASGPIAGFLIAIPVLIYGIRHSFVLSAQAVPFATISYPDPLLVRWLADFLLRPPEGTVILGHPTFWAGWFGLLVTSLNLLPGSMLDGGHAVRAALGARGHRMATFMAVGVALLLGYLPMAILIFLMIPRGHPGPLDDLTPLSPSRILLGLLLVAIFVVSAVPLWTVWR